MNESILLGFCQKCGSVCEMWEGIWRHISFSKECEEEWLSPDFIPGVIPVLSPNQMNILMSSQEFIDWLKERFPLSEPDKVFNLIRGLRENPFLVAKILKENEEEKK